MSNGTSRRRRWLGRLARAIERSGAFEVSEWRRLKPRALGRDAQATFCALEPRRFFAAHIVGDATVYATIQAAVDAASPGAIIDVDAGVYAETVSVFTPMTIRGARTGVDGRSNTRGGAGETIVSGADAGGGIFTSAFRIGADGVTLDGFTLEGETSPSDSNGAAVVVLPGRSGTHVVNNVIEHNVAGIFLANSSNTDPAVIRHNLFLENNTSGAASGRAIYSNGTISGGALTNVQIDANAFLRNRGDDAGGSVDPIEPAIGFEAMESPQSDIAISNNVFDGNGKALLAYNVSGMTIESNVVTDCRDSASAGLRFEGGCSDVTIRSNFLYASGAPAIRIDNKAAAGDNFNFVITANDITGNGQDSADEGLIVNAGQYVGLLDATDNWWGDGLGPGGDGLGGGDAVLAHGNLGVLFTPWALTPFAPTRMAYYGLPQDVTSPILLANFDHGGEGVTYHDSSTANTFDQLHPYQDVDIDVANDAAQTPFVTDTRGGEWIEYSVNVAAAGTYTLVARLATGQRIGGTFHVEIDGADVSGAINVPYTGGSQAWFDLAAGGIALPAGGHVLRLAMDSNGSAGKAGGVANFQSIWFTAVPPAPAPVAPGHLTASAISASRIDLAWIDHSSDENGFIVERSSDGFGGWTTIATLPADSTTFSDTSGLSPTKTYFYRVHAANLAGESPFSNLASAATLSPTSLALVPAGSTWKYLDDGSDQASAWRAMSFDDSPWNSGAGQLGYGDNDESSLVSFGGSSGSKSITTYFRKSFDVADRTAVSALVLSLQRDDGAVVYLNGIEVFRSNMPAAGAIAFDTLASSSVGGADESAWAAKSLSVGILRNRTNVLAVEVHQASASSSDLSFDLQLNATLFPPAPSLAAPSGLRATALSSSAVRLDWIDTVTNETGFRIERSIDGVSFSEVATVEANATTWTDDTLSPSEAARYRVRAYNTSGNSDYTAVASASTLSGSILPPTASNVNGSASNSYGRNEMSRSQWTRRRSWVILMNSHKPVGVPATSDRVGAWALLDVAKQSLLPLTIVHNGGILSEPAMY